MPIGDMSSNPDDESPTVAATATLLEGDVRGYVGITQFPNALSHLEEGICVNDSVQRRLDEGDEPGSQRCQDLFS